MSVNKFYLIAKKRLFPICRSITGKGIIKSLKIIKKDFKELKIKRIRSRTKVFDWKIPDEWNIKDAYVLDKFNNKIIKFTDNNLHILNYSSKFKGFVSKKKLIANLYSQKKRPDAIPYVTSYYKKRWGFCVSDNYKKKILRNYKKTDNFFIYIDSTHNKNGYLSYGELILPGKSRQEILISTYLCHPSMANNELSGPIVAQSLIKYFKKKKLNKTLRFLFIPETIGSISYISKNLEYLKNYVIGGYNLSCIGDERMHSCMLSKYENTPADKSLLSAYKELKIKFKQHSFLKRGSDERQYNSPKVNLPIASIFRTKYETYPEYHTSDDNFKIVTLKGLRGGYNVAKKAITLLDKMIIPKSKILCEPNLGKRGMYSTLGLGKTNYKSQKILDFLQYSDGNNNLEEISKLIKIKYKKAKSIYKILTNSNLIN